MAVFPRLTLLCVTILLVAGCSHSPPRLIQVFNQVNRVFDPESRTWSSQLSVFVQASSPDGNRVFDRLHLIHDAQNLAVSLTKEQWALVERPGEFWVGTNGLNFPDGQVPTGTWRALLVTRSGQKTESSFEVPPQPPSAPAARTGAVTVKPDAIPGRYRVSGWTEDYLVWARDAKETVFSRTKTVGSGFQLPPGTQTFVLYSYDKARGEGLKAGPFPVQENRNPADR